MKQVKILKRPSPVATTPSKPTERVASEISSLLEASLTRERARLESMYRARQEALLRAISNVLNEALEKAVAQAAKREMDALVVAMANLNADTVQDSNKKILTDQTTQEMRAAFAAAFERVSVPAFETCIAEMLRDLATLVDSQVDQHIVKPATGVATSVETAADALRSAKGTLADISPDNDARDDAVIQDALDSGDMRTALQLAVDKSPKIKAKTVSAVLDASVRPEEAFSGEVPPMTDLVNFSVLLATDLSDRTESRLAWLYEILTLMDDAQLDRNNMNTVESIKSKMQDTIETLSTFHKDGSPGPAEAKHTKLLIRVFKAHLNTL